MATSGSGDIDVVYSRDNSNSDDDTLSEATVSAVSRPIPDHFGQFGSIQNILPPGAVAVPGLEQLVSGLSLSSVPEAYLQKRIRIAQHIFVKTVGYEYVRECLDCYGHVLICGSPGSGKTTMALYIMGEYLKMNYKVVFLDDVSRFNPEKHVSLFSPTLIVLDDIFGYFALTTKEKVNCKRIFKYLKAGFQRFELKQNEENEEEKERSDSEVEFKVIMTSRTNVFEMIRTKLLEYKNSLLRESSIADLNTLTKLLDVEKERILKKHLKKADISLTDDAIRTISKLEYSTLGFPHLCELFVDSLCPEESAVEFFKQPMTYLVHQIAEIFSTPETRDRAGVLLLMILNDGVLSLVDLQGTEENKETELGAKLTKCEEIVKNLPSPNDLYIAARNENNTFLSCEGDIMKFSHPTIQDAVAFTVGDRNPLFVLENCSLQFIIERTKVLEEGMTNSPSGRDFTNFEINLLPGSTEYLVKRLAREITDRNFALPLSHQCFKSENIVQLLFSELSSFDNMERNLHSPDKKYRLGFLFWASFNCCGPMCQKAFQLTEFSIHEILEACLGCCMSGNVPFLMALISAEPTDEIVIQLTKTTVGNILEYQKGTKPFYRSLSTAGRRGKPNFLPEIETRRMHGDSNDMLLHIAAANGFPVIVNILIELGTEIDSRGGNDMTALMHACYLGFTKLAKMLLTSGADPFLLDKEGDNCIHLACRGGSIQIVQLLYEENMDLNTRGQHDRTPLMYASYNGREKIVKFLLEKEAVAEPNLTFARNQDNCLYLACVKGYLNVTKILLDQGRMDIEKVGGRKQRTPLMFACRNGKLEIAKELIAREANVRVVDQDNFTCLHLAAINGHIPTAELLTSLKAVDTIDCLTSRRRTPLMFALNYGQIDMVEFLLDHGANLKYIDTEHTSCLHFAVRSGVLPLIDLCLDAGLDISSATDTGLTPIISACYFGNTDLLKYLVEKGADVNNGSPGGCLHSAVFKGSMDIVTYLVSTKKDLDINKPGHQNKTPLMIACNSGFTEIAKYLMSCGADVECKDKYQRTCLHMVCQKGFIDLVEWLISLSLLDIDEIDVNGFTSLMYAVKTDCPDVIELLIQNGADMHMKDKNGRTYLHAAVWEGNAKSCAKLLDLGMDVNVPDKNNKTPLMSVVCNRFDRREVIKVLLDNGADVNQRTRKGDTCLHNAHNPVHAGILLDLGLDINARGAFSQTPIMSACRYGNVVLFDFLLQRKADVHLLDSASASCLHLASMSYASDIHIPTELLIMGLDVNARDNYNKTPAMYAVSHMNVHTLDLLLSRGSNLSTFDQKGIRDSLLHCACNVQNMHTEIPQLLIDMGMDVNVRDSYRRTPAMIAAKRGDRYLLEFLITSGADLRVVDKHGKNCLSHAEDGGHQELAEYLQSRTY